jgi:hypothetical protein
MVMSLHKSNGRAAGSFLLIQALAKKEPEDIQKEAQQNIPSEDHVIPSFPQHICRRIMTRADMLERLDQCNVVTIDPSSKVRTSSAPMMRTFREICTEENLDEILRNVLNRIAEVEFKDLKGREGRIQMRIDMQKGTSHWFT